MLSFLLLFFKKFISVTSNVMVEALLVISVLPVHPLFVLGLSPYFSSQFSRVPGKTILELSLLDTCQLS